jgi:NAD kinase
MKTRCFSFSLKELEPMGQYYRFVNTTKQIESTIPLPFNFNLPYAKSLEIYSKDELREKFNFVIQNNNWNKEDVVIAIGDYGTILYYPED